MAGCSDEALGLGKALDQKIVVFKESINQVLPTDQAVRQKRGKEGS